MYLELSLFWKKKINETFSVIYQKIEREKLNKMTYLHVSFQWKKLILLAKYCLWGLIFRPKSRCIFHHFRCRSAIFKDPRLNFWYVIQFFLLYKMIKEWFEKNLRMVSKNDSQWSPKRQHFWQKIMINHFFLGKLEVLIDYQLIRVFFT